MATKDTISIGKLNLTYVQVLNEENFKTMSHINSYMSIMQKCTKFLDRKHWLHKAINF